MHKTTFSLIILISQPIHPCLNISPVVVNGLPRPATRVTVVIRVVIQFSDLGASGAWFSILSDHQRLVQSIVIVMVLENGNEVEDHKRYACKQVAFLFLLTCRISLYSARKTSVVWIFYYFTLRVLPVIWVNVENPLWCVSLALVFFNLKSFENKLSLKSMLRFAGSASNQCC